MTALRASPMGQFEDSIDRDHCIICGKKMQAKGNDRSCIKTGPGTFFSNSWADMRKRGRGGWVINPEKEEPL